jgi:NADH-quinone oxidoreductase subunit L
MFELLWLVPAVPFASFVILALFGPRLPRRASAVFGAGSIGVSAVISILIAIRFLASPPPGGSYTQVLWTWIAAAGFQSRIAFYLDALSLVMVLVVTFVGFFIHLYSTEFMADDDGYSRFFAYMNLFVGSMITLLLADNLLLLYLGWEGVGLCSYLLIGFWYQDPANGAAGRKAFVVTRVGDTAFSIGLFLLFTHLGTLQIQDLMQQALARWPVGSALPIAAAALLLGGAVGKSAQLPLQTWLPDAMAGPTPTSALIHAATMVTAGVYLIARTHVLFALAPPVQFAVAVIGAATLLLAGFSALTQYDIKRILAYSTISQIGYMFLALGVGAWGAAIFHFMTHAFFKALLFLSAGIVINALHHEHSIFRMGGLRRQLPVAYWTFLIAGCSLAGLPLVTAGFYSKDLIVWEAWASPIGGPVFWIASVVGVFLTSLYIFRAIFIAFHGEAHTPVQHRPGMLMKAPAMVLAFFSIVAGFVSSHFIDFLQTALPAAPESHATGLTEAMSKAIAAAVFFIGFYAAYRMYLGSRAFVTELSETSAGRALHRFWFAGWGFDWLYERAFVRPVVWFARFDKSDFVDAIYAGLALLARGCYRALSFTETGRLRWYAACIVGGAVVYVAIVLLSS